MAVSRRSLVMPKGSDPRPHFVYRCWDADDALLYWHANGILHDAVACLLWRKSRSARAAS